MRWLLWTAGGYCVLMFILVGILPTLARQNTLYPTAYLSPDRQYRLDIARDLPLPFGLNGPGEHPGEVRVYDRFGRETDEEHVPDITKIGGITWMPYKVYFLRDEGDHWIRSSLDLAQ